MSIYCIIPARKGSKRIKNKNLIKINGEYLINRTVKHALNSKLIDKIYVSTNDQKLIKILPKKVNIINRPEKYSKDNSKTEDAISHFINQLILKKKKFPKLIVLLQCTSPLREKNDIDKSIILLKNKKYDSVFSGCKNKNLFWIKKTKLVPLNYLPKKRLREQKMQEQFMENGSIYVFKTKGYLKNKCRLFGKIGIYLMSKKNSFQLDDYEDKYILNKL
ncbi:MAG: hypothetical protein CL454_11655 [Acidimicrobiaceae bacterium]|nr:hypothetical protein [Acidimicrobiaceae bacterium]|tara:strand:- start:706 stop:1362 length:657 start_codon:yes stop_codon:yes gene_type:complete